MYFTLRSGYYFTTALFNKRYEYETMFHKAAYNTLQQVSFDEAAAATTASALHSEKSISRDRACVSFRFEEQSRFFRFACYGFVSLIGIAHLQVSDDEHVTQDQTATAQTPRVKRFVQKRQFEDICFRK